MDDDEEDAVKPDAWHTVTREVKCKDRGTQTPGPNLVSANGMLPCGAVKEPRPLFHDNAGFRRHFPAPFELAGQRGGQPSDMERDGDAPRGLMRLHHLHHLHQHQHHLQQQEQHLQQPPVAALGPEAHIGQKLRLIGDQFHGETLQQFHRNQRNQGGVWWRLASALLHLLFDRAAAAAAGWGGPR